MALAAGIVLILGALWYASAPVSPVASGGSGDASTTPAAAGPLDDFARCLAQKNFTMYGLYSCPHCQAEKALFGDSFRYVSYIECSASPDKCTAENVEAVPTWIEGDGTRLVGTQSLQELSQASGCILPSSQ